MSDRTDYPYPERVRCEISEQDLESYGPAADFINHARYDVLSVQHEYGIFGGEAGSYLLRLVREAKMPIVTTLHTVLREPSNAQREVLDELLQLSERVVVMSKKAVGFLSDVHAVPLDKIDLIPHGIPDIAQAAGSDFRATLGIEGPMILTFGLLSPDKGIQYVIEAMPEIVRTHPGTTYFVVGATHPNVRASAGESYRESLVALAERLGVAGNIRFVDRFVTSEELVDYLAAMDLYITPYLNPHQITSGTLAYAVGAGKAVISTPYWYAEELLAEGRGRLVPFRDAEAIAKEVCAIQSSPEERLEMGRRAADYGRQMLWPEVGRRYLESFARASRESSERLRELVHPTQLSRWSPESLPSIRLDHLHDLSDDTGILQHANFAIPNRPEGYCVDDNARALLYTVFLAELKPLSARTARLQSRYLSFVHHAYNPDNGRFRNFMSFDRRWLESAGSEDSHGRALWALGVTARRCEIASRRHLARNLFELGAPALLETTSLRTWAYGVLAIGEYLLAPDSDPKMRLLLRTMADRLWTAYQTSQSPEWPWFEHRLTYANARLAQALLVAGHTLENQAMSDAGLDSLAWLMDIQTGPGGVFAPIGSNGFYLRGEERSMFDQQPIEAAGSVSACLAAGTLTGNPVWRSEALRAFRWFLGENMLGLPAYDPSTGGCCDGLHAERVNRNQGAESTLSYLMALAELRKTPHSIRTRPMETFSHEIKPV
ncbi:MAG: glycosyltransferase family 4 protein [Fimbriimonadaceae bacterium]|nr:glycosyltransferase family 4 protein [Fimbriimonadaceae bacterium]